MARFGIKGKKSLFKPPKGNPRGRLFVRKKLEEDRVFLYS